MNSEFKPHISEFKKSEVDEIKKLANEYPVMGIVNMEGLPTLMLQRIKNKLKKDIVLKITKKRLMKIAIEQLTDKKDIQKLKEKLDGIPALLFTKEDPFILYQKIKKSMASSPAKPGQKAPNDLKIEGGATPFTPGPMIGELGMLGIKTEVKEGKIHVKEEKVLVKEGEEISEKVAELLAKLGVEPMKVGLNLTLTYQNGEILEKAVLSIDEEEYIENIKLAHTEAMALAMGLGIVNKDTAKPLTLKASREAKTISDKLDLPKTEQPESQPESQPAEQPEPKQESKQESQPESQPAEQPEPKQESQPVEQPEVKQEPEIKEQLSQPKVGNINAQQSEQPQEIPTKMVDTGGIQDTNHEKTLKKAQEVVGSMFGIKENTKTQEENLKNQDEISQGPNPIDINKLINHLKDKKIKGEI